MRRTLIALAGIPWAGAQGVPEPEPPPISGLVELLDTPVRSATKTWNSQREAPAVLTRFSARDIEEMGARTLADLLKRIPGVQIGDNRANVLMAWFRGVTTTYNEKILLLVDGMPKRDATLQEWAPDERFDLQNVESIEVIRGPGSAVHGGNAYAAVISIVTKKGKGSATFSLWGGDQGTLQAGVTDSKGDVDFSARAFKTDGWRSERGLQGAPTDNTSARSSRNLQAQGSLSANTSFNLVYGDFDYRYPMHEYPNFRDARYSYTLGSLAHRLKGRTWNWSSQLYFDNTRIRFHELTRFLDLTTKQSKDQDKEGMLFGFESRLEVNPHPRARALAGLSIENQKATYSEWETNPTSTDPAKLAYFNSWFSQDGEGPGRNVARATNGAAFAQGEFHLADPLILTLGARLDRFRGFGNELSPRVALVWHAWSEGTLKALFGHAFRPPTFRQLYVVRFDGYQPGNSDLRPERANTAELEFTQGMGAKTYLRMGLFSNVLTDTTVTIADGRWQTSPIPRRIRGMEAEWRGDFHPDVAGLRSLSVFLNGGYLFKAYDETPLGAVDIAHVAPFTANAGLTLRFPRFTAFTGLNYMGRRNPGRVYDPGLRQIVSTYHTKITDTYADWRARDNQGSYLIQDVNLRWSPGARSWVLEITAHNLWDAHHYNSSFDPDTYYDIVKEQRQVLLRWTRRF